MTAPLVAKTVPPTPLPATAINHMTLNVSDPAKSLDWYQGLFGMPIVARQGKTVILRIGDGPQFLAIDGDVSRKPGIAQIGLSIDNFDAKIVLANLEGHGLKISSKAEPMTAQAQTRGSELGGATDGTPEIYLKDPDGIEVQVQDATYCGGSGPLGDICSSTPQPPPSNGLINVRDYNHFTVFVNDQSRSVAFYQRLFRLPIDTYQGSLPILRVGAGNQFLAFVGAGQRDEFKPFIHHACLTVNNFEPDSILESLAKYGVTPRGDNRESAKPLQSYVTMRMPNRGGATDGTPELYFTDPDGILLQIQDVRYSGRSGYLGDERGTPKEPDR